MCELDSNIRDAGCDAAAAQSHETGTIAPALHCKKDGFLGGVRVCGEFRFRKNASLPRLAWCAELAQLSPTVTVEHGPWVETRPGSFVEGVWNAPFATHDLAGAEVVLGSGGFFRGSSVAFTPTTHTMERLYSLRLDRKLFISNSFAYLLEATGSNLDVRDWSYEPALMTFLRGYKRAGARDSHLRRTHRAAALPSQRHGRRVSVARHGGSAGTARVYRLPALRGLRGRHADAALE